MNDTKKDITSLVNEEACALSETLLDFITNHGGGDPTFDIDVMFATAYSGVHISKEENYAHKGYIVIEIVLNIRDNTRTESSVKAVRHSHKLSYGDLITQFLDGDKSCSGWELCKLIYDTAVFHLTTQYFNDDVFGCIDFLPVEEFMFAEPFARGRLTGVEDMDIDSLRGTHEE